MRHIWINGVLNASLADAARLALGLKHRSDMLSLGNPAIRRPQGPSAPLSDETTILDLFDGAAGALLILGKPGSGKTTLLLTLAEALLDRAENDSSQPIPFVFNLSSWGQGNHSFTDWLVSELSTIYNVPFSKASAWIEQNALTLLLDALDEVTEGYRAKCVDAINDYRRDHGLVQMAVCCRTHEFERLYHKANLDEAVELLPPTSTQIDTYLSYLEATGTPLTDVRTAMTHDVALQELLHSPLMLHVIALAYHGRPAVALNEPGSNAERRDQLWNAYIARMFEQRPLPAYYGYNNERATDWLSYLADALRHAGQSQFRLDFLSPKSTPVRQREFSYFRLFALFPLRILDFLCNPDMIDVSDYEWHASKYRDFKSMQPFWTSFLASAGTGIAIGLIYNPLPGLISAIAVILLSLVISSTFAHTVFHQQLVSPFGTYQSINNETAEPNAMIWHVARVGAAAGICAFLIAGVLAGLGFGFAFGSDSARTFGLSIGVWFGICWGLISGGYRFLSHFACRYVMVLAGSGPWKYKAFLDAMTQRLLLRRAGPSYLFVHLSLRDHLADRVSCEDVANPDNGHSLPSGS